MREHKSVMRRVPVDLLEYVQEQRGGRRRIRQDRSARSLFKACLQDKLIMCNEAGEVLETLCAEL